MTEYAEKNQEQEIFSLGMALKGFFIGVVTISAIWLLSGLLELLSKTLG
jgi:hypothetical protein